jgi:hypothetical protein
MELRKRRWHFVCEIVILAPSVLGFLHFDLSRLHTLFSRCIRSLLPRTTHWHIRRWLMTLHTKRRESRVLGEAQLGRDSRAGMPLKGNVLMGCIYVANERKNQELILSKKTQYTCREVSISTCQDRFVFVLHRYSVRESSTVHELKHTSNLSRFLTTLTSTSSYTSLLTQYPPFLPSLHNPLHIRQKHSIHVLQPCPKRASHPPQPRSP